jgi:hypothetical protein
MRTRVSRRRLAGRLLLLAVLAVLVSAAVAAPAAPAPVFRPSSLLLAVSGTHNFGVAGTWAVSGNATISSKLYPIDPCRVLVAFPVDPCRVLTIASVVTASLGGNSCRFTGATSKAVAVTDTQTTVDAIVVPGNPLFPTDPCAPLAPFAIRYVVGFAGDGTITSATASTEPVT